MPTGNRTAPALRADGKGDDCARLGELAPCLDSAHTTAEEPTTWAEIARRLGTYPHTVKRWCKEGVRPHFRHRMALLDLADDLGLAHLLTAWTVPDEARREMPKAVPPRCRSPKRKAARRRGGRDRRD